MNQCVAAYTKAYTQTQNSMVEINGERSSDPSKTGPAADDVKNVPILVNSSAPAEILAALANILVAQLLSNAKGVFEVQNVLHMIPRISPADAETPAADELRIFSDSTTSSNPRSSCLACDPAMVCKCISENSKWYRTFLPTAGHISYSVAYGISQRHPKTCRS